MKPISITTLSSLPVSGSFSDAQRTADDDARLRRDAERVRQRRLQHEHRQQAKAESRSADAVARASARGTQLTTTPRTLQGDSISLSISQRTGISGTAGSVAEFNALASTAVRKEEEAASELSAEAAQAARITNQQHEELEELSDPVRSVLLRLTSGQSRGLLQDCAPMLEAIRVQLRERMPPGLEDVSERESLASALDFLQGYADAAAGRVPGVDKFASLVTAVRQQFDALHPAAIAASAVAVAAAATSQTSASPDTGSALARWHDHRTPRERERVEMVRKFRRSRDNDVLDDEDHSLTATAMAVAASAGMAQDKLTPSAESSLDKDQRKRRDDTLLLMTLRSI